jgi:hypothetical protein
VAAALALIGGATLTPTPGAMPVLAGPLCLVCGDYGGVDVLLNLLLFAPLGVGLRAAGAQLRVVALVALAATLAVEALQWQLIAGRDTSLSDVVCNTLGAVAGGVLAARWRGIALPRARAAARLAAAGVAGWLALAAGTAWSLTLQSAGPEVLYRRSPPARHWAWFPGRVLGVSANGAAIPRDSGDGDGRFAVPVRVAPGGPLEIGAEVVAGGPVVGRAAVAVVLDPDGRDVAALGQRQRDFAFRIRTAASRLRLRVPGLTVLDVFAPRDERGRAGGGPVAGDTVRVAASYTRRELRLTVRWRGGGRSLAAPLHPWLGWSYLLPWDYGLDGRAAFLSALWAGGLLAPAAYWAWLAGGGRRGPLLVGVLGAGGLAGIPMIAATAPAPAAVWVGTLAGVIAGAAAARRLAAPADRAERSGR